MPKLSFEKMVLDDLEEVYVIEQRNYPVPWSKAVVSDCIKSDYHSVILKDDSKIIAYAFLMTALDEAHLLNMCVDKSQQGKGNGRKMLKYLENICRYNCSKTFLLEVRESNLIAYHLYKSFGFRQIGLRKNYYKCIKGRENAIVMRKDI